MQHICLSKVRVVLVAVVVIAMVHFVVIVY